MKEQKHDIVFSLILVAVSGFLFFSLGLFAAWKWGFAEQRVLIQYEVTEPSATTTTTAPSLKVDLNSATVDDLMQIDGIGEKTAQKIIQYRTTIGKYTFIEQLLDVEGVGEKKLDSWRAYLFVETTATVTTTTMSEIINLNTATVQDLMRIDGIGEKTAQKIIDYRESIGGFTSLEQLMEIEGVGEKKFNAWRKYLTIN